MLRRSFQWLGREGDVDSAHGHRDLTFHHHHHHHHLRREPSIAALMGRWFWWPLKVRPRPASSMLRPYGTRPSVRALLREGEDAEQSVG